MSLKNYQRYAVAIIPLIILGLIFYFFSDIMTYIVIAWTLSMIGAPITDFFRKWIGSSGAAIVTILCFALSFLIILYVFIPPILQQTRNLAKVDYEQVINNLEEPISDWNQWLVKRGLLEDAHPLAENNDIQEDKVPETEIKVYALDSLLNTKDSTHTGINIFINIPRQDVNSEADTEIAEKKTSFLDRLRSNIFELLNPAKIPEIFGSLVGVLGNILVAIMSVFFITFFFLKERGLFTQIVKSLVPNDTEDQWTHALDETAHMLMRYFTGVVIQVTVITLLVSTALSLLGFEYALLIGFFAALMNVIPYMGPILGASFGILITISSHLDVNFYQDMLPRIGLILLVFAGMQLIDNVILQPNIFSKSVKAHPLEIFLIVLVGAKVGGVLGMVIAIPVYTVLRVLAKVFLSEFKIVKKMTQGL